MTKDDFAKQYDFEALRYACRVEITFNDGHIKEYEVQNYWDSPPELVDAMECWDLDAPSDASEDIKYPIYYVPSPEIASIRILAKVEQPNHGPHPEIAIIFPDIDELYPQKT